MSHETITSRQNPRVKNVDRLRSRRHRREQGRFVIDGAREILQAIDAGIEIAEAFVCDSQCGSDDARAAAVVLRQEARESLDVSPTVFEKLAFGERTDGVLAVAVTPERSLARLTLPAEPLVAVLEGIEKPGNVGAILRSAEGAGVDAVVVADPASDLFNPNTIRGSLGTVFAPTVVTARSQEVLPWLREMNLRLVAARPDAEQEYTAADLRGGVAIVLGSEATGLTSEWDGADVLAVRLPMLGRADSLNVSATAAVLFYEARRQRGSQSF